MVSKNAINKKTTLFAYIFQQKKLKPNDLIKEAYKRILLYFVYPLSFISKCLHSFSIIIKLTVHYMHALQHFRRRISSHKDLW